MRGVFMGGPYRGKTRDRMADDGSTTFIADSMIVTGVLRWILRAVPLVVESVHR